MKTRMILAALLLVAFGTMKAQNQAPTEVGKNVNSVVVNATGDVTIRQSDQYVALWDSEHERHVTYNMADTAVYLDGTVDFDVTLHELNHLTLLSSGDVMSAGVLKGKDLTVTLTGSGDVELDLDYDNVYVTILGSGDVKLRGRCKTFVSQGSGSGDLDIRHLQYGDRREIRTDMPDMAGFSEIMAELGETLQQLSDSVDFEKFERDMEKWGEKMEAWGRGMEAWGKRMEKKQDKHYEYHYEHNYSRPAPKDNESESSTKKKSPIFNPHWAGFDGGLNMLIDPSVMNVYTGPNESMAIRPLRSWYFGFNLVDFGVAFDKDRKVGMFTGIGLGWNNYSWKNHVRMTVENEQLVNNLLPDDRPVKNSKFGLLYAQAPLMIEVRPTRHMFIDFGVTGGIRLAAWNRIKYSDGSNEKTYSNYLTNLFKCDASFRIGGDNLGFFVNYALIPTFVKGRDADKAHPLMLGFSIVY